MTAWVASARAARIKRGELRLAAMWHKQRLTERAGHPMGGIPQAASDYPIGRGAPGRPRPKAERMPPRLRRYAESISAQKGHDDCRCGPSGVRQ